MGGGRSYGEVMRIAIAGAHGQIGLRLGRLLADRGDEVVGLIRKPEQEGDLRDAGVEPAVVDLESSSVGDVAGAIDGCDAVVFAAGAGPGSSVERKDSVDRGAAVLLAEACDQAGIRRYLLVSSMGTDSVRDGATPDGMDDVFVAYLRAKLAAEEALLARDLDLTVLRPGSLTDDTGTGKVTLNEHVDRGEVSRDDVAAVLAAMLVEPGTAGKVLELVGGDVTVSDAVSAARG